MLNIGFVGWRGMVGRVVQARLASYFDTSNGCNRVFFSSSQVKKGFEDAYDLEALRTMDIILTCQGGAYTEKMHGPLRASGWKGYWLDASSALRMRKTSLLVLDPINGDAIDRALHNGVKDYIGANCTVSLLLLALHGLLKKGHIEWLSVSSYQAISGAGARKLSQCFEQVGRIAQVMRQRQDCDVLKTVQAIHNLLLKGEDQPAFFANVLPWIDAAVPQTGQTKEEWKGMVEANQLLGAMGGNGARAITIESTCVRVPVLRAHSQAVLMKLNTAYTVDELSKCLQEANPWVKWIPNEAQATLKYLTPLAVSNSLSIHVGRLRRVCLDDSMWALFTVGDQLLWGGAEPLCRMLKRCVQHLRSR